MAGSDIILTSMDTNCGDYDCYKPSDTAMCSFFAFAQSSDR